MKYIEQSRFTYDYFFLAYEYRDFSQGGIFNEIIESANLEWALAVKDFYFTTPMCFFPLLPFFNR